MSGREEMLESWSEFKIYILHRKEVETDALDKSLKLMRNEK